MKELNARINVHPVSQESQAQPWRSPRPVDSTVVSRLTYDGEEIVVSRFGDNIWDLSPIVPNVNLADCKKNVYWPPLPPSLLLSGKLICLRYWNEGLHFSIRPAATTVIKFSGDLITFLSWLANAAGLQCLADVSREHISAYTQHCRDTIPSPSTQTSRLLAVEACWTLRDPEGDCLPFHPWPNESACLISGYLRGIQTEAKTKVIPGDVCSQIFAFTADLISRADQIIAENPSIYQPSRDWLLLRAACYFRLGITTGMRNHELASIGVGCLYDLEIEGSHTLWIRGDSLKTHVGQTSWQAPDDAKQIVAILEKMSKPLRDWISLQIPHLRNLAISGSRSDQERKNTVKKLVKIERNSDRLFLGFCASQNSVQVPNVGRWGGILQELFSAAGCSWKISTHQLRRTFAVYVAGHALGDLRYLRWHFKHVSIDMTALYATHVSLDEELINDISTAYFDGKVRIITDLLSDDQLISGGAGSQLREFRKGRHIHMFDSRMELAAQLEPSIRIRATAHGYCVANTNGCGGPGPFEPAACANCSNSVITPAHSQAWSAMYEHTKELLEIPGLSDQERVRLKRDIERMRGVLVELGFVF